jgi:hypothetical protein
MRSKRSVRLAPVALRLTSRALAPQKSKQAAAPTEPLDTKFASLVREVGDRSMVRANDGAWTNPMVALLCDGANAGRVQRFAIALFSSSHATTR